MSLLNWEDFINYGKSPINFENSHNAPPNVLKKLFALVKSSLRGKSYFRRFSIEYN